MWWHWIGHWVGMYWVMLVVAPLGQGSGCGCYSIPLACRPWRQGINKRSMVSYDGYKETEDAPYPFTDMDVSILSLLASHTHTALFRAQTAAEMVRRCMCRRVGCSSHLHVQLPARGCSSGVVCLGTCVSEWLYRSSAVFAPVRALVNQECLAAGGAHCASVQRFTGLRCLCVMRRNVRSGRHSRCWSSSDSTVTA